MSEINAIYNLNEVPLFTYGMIGFATLVLAGITMMDKESDSFVKDDGYKKISKSKEILGGDFFGSESKSEENQTKPQENTSMFGNIFGSESKPEENQTKPQENTSMFGNMFAFGSTTEQKKPQENTSIFGMFTSNKNQTQEIKGGKYNNKTKHNKRQNTYTRKR